MNQVEFQNIAVNEGSGRVSGQFEGVSYRL
jgi:hypothetical protein